MGGIRELIGSDGERTPICEVVKADLLNNIVQEIGLTTKLEAPDYRVMLAIGYSPLAHQNPMVICRAARSSGNYHRPFLSY